MNAYQAMMKAADHIERHPHDFEYVTNQRPGGCGTPGCMLGWTGFFLGVESGGGHSFAGDVAVALGLSRLGDFIARSGRIREEHGGLYYHSMMPREKAAPNAARVLRLYAEKYHGHEKPQQRPTSELVADLMAQVMADRIPEGMLESAEYGQ